MIRFPLRTSGEGSEEKQRGKAENPEDHNEHDWYPIRWACICPEYKWFNLA